MNHEEKARPAHEYEHREETRAYCFVCGERESHPAHRAALGEARGTASASESPDKTQNSEQGALRASADELRAKVVALEGQLSEARKVLDAVIDDALEEPRSVLRPSTLMMVEQARRGVLSPESLSYTYAPTAPPAPDLLRENARLREEAAKHEGCMDEARKDFDEALDQQLDRAEKAEAELTRARAAHLENATLLAKANGLLRDVRPTLDDINGLLGGEGDPEGECVARNAGLLRDRIDLLLADRKGNAAEPPLGPDVAAAAAAPAKEGK